MIRNRLSVLMAERDIRVTRLASDTGISRNTITSTAQNDGKMIQLETINKICQALSVSPKDFFEYVPFDFENIISPFEPQNITKYPISIETFKKTISWESDLLINVFEKNSRKETIEGNIEIASSAINTTASVPAISLVVFLNVSGKQNESILKKYSDLLSVGLATQADAALENQIVEKIISYFTQYENDVGLELESVTFGNNLFKK